MVLGYHVISLKSIKSYNLFFTGENGEEREENQKDIAGNQAALDCADLSLFSHGYHPLSG